ncbi:MAG: acetoin utilization protein AcuC [Pseudomonadota bacterium]
MPPLPDRILIGSEVFRHSSYGGTHPLRIPRVSTVMDLSRALGWLPPDRYRTSPRAKPKTLELWHTPAYIAALQQAEHDGEVSEATRQRHSLGTVANPVFPEVWRRPATSSGGALLAATLLKDPGIVYVPSAGTHHAFPDRAGGFCYFNDPVLAILTLRAHGLRRIAYIDIDAHHPDGVEHAFAQDRDTLMISIHEERRWPFTGALEDAGAGTVFNLPVPRGLNDTEMAHITDRLILPRLDAFEPHAIVFQCGADAVEEDPLSRLALSNNAHWSIARALMARTDRLLALGGGGYNPWSVGRLWTGLWGTLCGQTLPDRLPIEAEAVLRDLTWDRPGKNRPIPDNWFTTLRDIPRPGPIRNEVSDRLDHLAQRSLPSSG